MRLKSIRMVPKYTRGMSWLAFLSIITMINQAKTQEQTYTAPDVNIFVTPDQPFNLPGSGDYIPAEEIRKYNFDNINNILRNTPGVYNFWSSKLMLRWQLRMPQVEVLYCI